MEETFQPCSEMYYMHQIVKFYFEDILLYRKNVKKTCFEQTSVLHQIALSYSMLNQSYGGSFQDNDFGT